MDCAVGHNRNPVTNTRQFPGDIRVLNYFVTNGSHTRGVKHSQISQAVNRNPAFDFNGTATMDFQDIIFDAEYLYPFNLVGFFE